MVSTKEIALPKLKGTSNYIIQSLKTSAHLTKEGCLDAILNGDVSKAKSEKALANIQLLCEDGPLLQIKHYTNAFAAWKALKELYNPRGFTSEYLLIKELFEATLDKYPSIEEYLNKVKEISDELKARSLELPKQVVIAWILYGLGDSYDGLVSNITQSLRRDPNAYNFESLASTLIDEAKRQDSKEVTQSLIV